MKAVACVVSLLLVVTWVSGQESSVAGPASLERASKSQVRADVEFRLVHEEPSGGADSAISPDGKWMAFSSRRTGNLDLWIVDVETGKLKQLTKNPASDYEPKWHPDGGKIVFTSERHGNQDVFTIDIETLEQTRITSTRNSEDYPSFSKDGSEIVFTGGPWGRREVHVKNLESGKIRQVTDGHRLVGSASFSPDGKQIVYHVYYKSYSSGSSDVLVVPSEGGKGKLITDDKDIWDYKANWSYDGRWIAFSSKRTTSNFNIWIMGPGGKELTPVTNLEGLDLRWPNWTKDGRLSWHRIDPQAGRIMVADVKTGEVKRLVQSNSFIEGLVPSPDGKKIAYSAGWRVCVIDAKADASPTRLAVGQKPRWSRDGKTISFLASRRETVRMISADGGKTQRLRVRPAYWPTTESSGWSPDGKTLAMVVETSGKQDLVLVSRDGSTRKLTKDGQTKTSPVWSADGRHVFFCSNRPLTVRYYLTSLPVVTP
ncbi:MAG: PD40 domain-containing protein [Planctomycetes bacterium]|nr:PD40 domain-containing protein [Planctomycetota bacterium]